VLGARVSSWATPYALSTLSLGTVSCAGLLASLGRTWPSSSVSSGWAVETILRTKLSSHRFECLSSSTDNFSIDRWLIEEAVKMILLKSKAEKEGFKPNNGKRGQEVKEKKDKKFGAALTKTN
jgi:hypothetical protein